MNGNLKTVILLVAMFVSGPALAQVSAYGAAARVNGVEIRNATLEKNFEEYQRENNVNIAAIRYPDRVKEMKREVLEELIDQELIWQVVQEKGLYASAADVDRSLDQIRSQFENDDAFLKRITIEGFTEDGYREHVRRIVSASLYLQRVSEANQVTADEIHEFYASNPDKFEMPEMVRARHILLKVHPSANDKTRGAVRERMESIVAELDAGADFAALATSYSEDPSSSAGGDLGYFHRGQMVASFEEVAFATEIGSVSGIVETIYGLHVIQVLDRQPAQIVPEELAQEQIYEHLLEVKRRQAMRDEVSTLRANADIEILIPL